MLSWRDPKNPLAGGAEAVTHELLKRFVAAGHSCTWFTSAFRGSKTYDDLDGISIIRKGGSFGVYYQAYSFLSNRSYDLVIDQVNTIPFFTPLYYSGKKVAFFHQLAEKIWFYEMKFPFSWIGYLAEKLYLRLYSTIPTFTVSQSTKKNLRRYGIRNAFVFRNCIDTKPLKNVPKKVAGSFVYVGRIKRSKRVHDIIESFSLALKQNPGAKLDIIGRGDLSYERELKKLVRKHGLEKKVVFHGYLNKTKRNIIVKKAEAILVTSVKEGWGLIVVEANAMGTPAIVYDVDGLRDSVIDGKTGIVVMKKNPVALAKKMNSFLSDTKGKKELSSNALAYSKEFDWDAEADSVLEFLARVVVK